MKRYTVFIAMVIGMSGCNNYSDQLKEAPPLSGDSAAGREVFKTYSCAGCHGDDGRTPALGVSRIIADMDDARDVENALFALQSLTSDRHDAMKSVAADLSTQEIVDVSVYIANEL